MEPELVDGLNQSIEIWRRGAVTTDDYGNESQLYSKYLTVLGRFEFLTGTERRDAEEYESYRQRVILDANVDVTAADQIRYLERHFQIGTVYVRYDWDGTEHHRVAYLEEIV